MPRPPRKNRAGHFGTSMMIVQGPKKSKKQKKREAKARYFATEQKIGKEAMKKKKQFENEVRNTPRKKTTPKSDVTINDQMKTLKEQAIKEGKYLGK